jgi:hypothetical protein
MIRLVLPDDTPRNGEIIRRQEAALDNKFTTLTNLSHFTGIRKPHEMSCGPEARQHMPAAMATRLCHWIVSMQELVSCFNGSAYESLP